MSKVVIWILWSCFLCIVNGKTEKYYQFGKDCSVTIEYVDEDKIFYAEYYGNSELPSYCNDMSFVGRDDGYLNEYEICVTPVTYEDPDCSMELRYSSDYSGYDDVQKYTCTNKPTHKYCGKQDDYFYIRLKKMDGRSTNNVRVKLKIEAVMTYNYGQTVGIIVGSVFGGIFLVTIIIGIIVIVVCRRKRSPGQVMNPAGTTSLQMQQTNISSAYTTYPTQTQGTYPTQPTGYNQLQTNYSTNYSTALGNNQTAGQQPSGFAYSNSPPSYSNGAKM